MYFVRMSMAPDSASALVMMSTAATVMTAAWPKPWKAALGSTTPANTATMRAQNATRS